MKRGAAVILHPEQESYLDRLLPPRDAVLREMEERAARENIPISDPEVGKLLGILARATGARRILEIGAAIGYGAIWLARGAAEARVYSVDIDPERLAAARGYLERAGVADQVELIEGAALEVIHRLDGPFDLVYVDAVKTEYRKYLDLVLPKLRVGGVIVCDNLLWGGQVAAPDEDREDRDADALRSFNGYLMMHPQLQAVVLPLGDGVGLATKIKPTMFEMGGPF
ncbi:MAG TPA: O-methyltransferase [Thermoanaerobaculia bacterium]|jgi:predicted O-methyltransferase YrrM|nr:O-methyltransferase [Thermoanaerobaculia bacterium]